VFVVPIQLAVLHPHSSGKGLQIHPGAEKEMRENANPAEDLIPSYLGRLTQAPLLKPEEEILLTTAAQKGDESARQKLVESNMRLVINIAKSYRSRSVPIEDLIQEGAIGLIYAVQRFDPSKGYRFSTYATHWIRQTIGRALDNKSKAIRIPAHITQSMRKIDRERARLAAELGYEPSQEQTAIALGITTDKLNSIIQATQEMLSLDMKLGDSDQTTLGALVRDFDGVDPYEVAMQVDNVRELHEIMQELNDRERTIMLQRMKVEDNEELSNVRERLSREMQISRERIRQIELQAIRKLRAVAIRRKNRDQAAMVITPEI
jgi:RNA polymerase primary sigma factor